MTDSTTPEQDKLRAVIDPSAEQFKALFAYVPAQGPVWMLNLLAFREVADDPPGQGRRSGREAYATYSQAVGPLLAAAGGRVKWWGAAHLAVIAPAGESWDEVLVVEYPSRDAFVRMVQSPEYQAVVHHRRAALRDARLIATTLRARR